MNNFLSDNVKAFSASAGSGVLMAAPTYFTAVEALIFTQNLTGNSAASAFGAVAVGGVTMFASTKLSGKINDAICDRFNAPFEVLSAGFHAGAGLTVVVGTYLNVEKIDNRLLHSNYRNTLVVEGDVKTTSHLLDLNEVNYLPALSKL